MESTLGPKILFVTPAMYTFTKSDISILSSKFDVVVNIYDWKKKTLTPFWMILQVAFILKHIRVIKSIFIHFGGYWSVVPSLIGRIFKVPVFIVLHGTDSCSLPSIGYGSLRKPLLRWACFSSYKNATMLLPVSDSLLETRSDYHGSPVEEKQGVFNFFPRLITPHKTISNGLQIDFWSPKLNVSKEARSFVTVISEGQMIRKGGDLILETSQYFPDCNFYIAGCQKPDLVDQNKNVHFLGRLSSEELKLLYSKCQFYLQLSVFEGFGLSLCEAMLCNCVPIGSSVNEIPNIIGETGYLLTKRDVKELITMMNVALNEPNLTRLGTLARERIKSNYGIERRKQSILSILESC